MVGVERGANLSKLSSMVQLVSRALSERAGGSAAAASQADGGAPGAGGGTPIAPAASFTGAINSTGDVVRALEAICEFYERHEPSSPIPLLLKRTRRLVSKSFLDIVRDLVPEAVAHVEALQGKQE
jgi:type VI secretion system protein ImpA